MCTELGLGWPQVCRHARVHATRTRNDAQECLKGTHLKMTASSTLSQPTGKRTVRSTAAALQAAPGPKGSPVCRASRLPHGSPGLGSSETLCASVCTSISARGGRARTHTRRSVHGCRVCGCTEPLLHTHPHQPQWIGGRPGHRQPWTSQNPTNDCLEN